jgi:hypothetical protein
VTTRKKAPVATKSSLRIEKAPWGCLLAVNDVRSQTAKEDLPAATDLKSKCASKGIPVESQ